MSINRTIRRLLVLVVALAPLAGCPTVKIQSVEVAADGSGIFVLTKDQGFAHVPDRCMIEAAYGPWRSQSIPPISAGISITRTWLTHWVRSIGTPNNQEGVLRVRFLYNGQPVATRDFHGVEFDPTRGGAGRDVNVQVQLNQNQNTNTNVNNNTSMSSAQGLDAGPRDNTSAAGTYCPACGTRALDRHRFCAQCGENLRRR